MSTRKSPPPAPNTPEIERCPRCNNPILIGDQICSQCGYNLKSWEDTIAGWNPNFVAGIGVGLGTILLIAAWTGMEGVLQGIFLVLAAGAVAGGGLFMAYSYLFLDVNRRRK